MRIILRNKEYFMKKILKNIIIIAAFLQIITLCGYYKVYTMPGSGVKLVCGVENDMFPRSWRGGRINGQASGFSRRIALRKLALFKKELNRYPARVLRNNLRKIYILKKLSFYGKGYGGTYLASKKAIYIAARFSNQYVKRLLHAEFSSVLLKSYRRHFSKSAWRALNKSGTRYGRGGRQALITGKASTRYKPYYFKQGFLYQYGKASVEEDFNSFSGNIFGRKSKFWNAVNNYKVLRKKFRYTVSFYNKIDSTFTITYFTKMAGRTLKKMQLDMDNNQKKDPDDDNNIKDPNDNTPANTSFSGTWKTRWGRMVLTQNGSKVTGTYGSKGRIQGTIRDGRLYFKWTEGPRSWGKGYFKLSTNGKKFTGRWGRRNSRTSGGSWYGNRIE